MDDDKWMTVGRLIEILKTCPNPKALVGVEEFFLVDTWRDGKLAVAITERTVWIDGYYPGPRKEEIERLTA